MDGLGNANPLKTLGTDNFLLEGSFQCNAGSNPVAANNRSAPGVIWTVTYTATGIFTVVLDASLNLPDFPLGIAATPQAATLATDWFECFVVGEYTKSTRTFIIQAHRNGVAQAPAATAGNRINWRILARNSTSR